MIGLEMKFLRICIAAFSALLLSGVAGYYFGRDPEDSRVAEGRDVAAQALLTMELPRTDGQMQKINQWLGQVIVINYWATWCPPCREEMPSFSRLQGTFARNGVQFVGVSIDSVEKVLAFQAQTPVSYPLLIGTASSIDVTAALGNSAQGLPFTVILDRTGNVAKTHIGRFDEDELAASIKNLL